VNSEVNCKSRTQEYSVVRFFFRHRLRVFENKVLRSILGPKRDEVTGGWRELRNKELPGLYPSQSIIRIIYQY
jgi:hypothetical protein